MLITCPVYIYTVFREAVIILYWLYIDQFSYLSTTNLLTLVQPFRRHLPDLGDRELLMSY